jgi:hypothetical protein
MTTEERDVPVGRVYRAKKHLASSRTVRLGQESTVVFRLAPEEAMGASRLYCNAPAPGVVIVEKILENGREIATPPSDMWSLRPGNVYIVGPLDGEKDEILITCLVTKVVPDGFRADQEFELIFDVLEETDGTGGTFGLDDAPPPLTAEVAERHRRRREATEKRMLKLDPNKDSDIKVEEYLFPLSTLVLEVGKDRHFAVSGSPLVPFRATGLRINVPRRGVLFVKAIWCANINAVVGGPPYRDPEAPPATVPDSDHWVDAYDVNAGMPLDLPVMAPQNTMKVEYYYSGEPVDEGGYAKPWRLTTTFFGLATVVA